MLDQVKEVLEEHIEEVFRVFQDRRLITDGDIAPLDAVELDDLTDKISHLIEKVLDYQTPQFNSSLTVEVIEDIDEQGITLRKGDILFATDSTETHFIIACGDRYLYLPHESFRVIPHHI